MAVLEFWFYDKTNTNIEVNIITPPYTPPNPASLTTSNIAEGDLLARWLIAHLPVESLASVRKVLNLI